MGILISRFRRKPTVRQQLEKIEKELENIEDFKYDTQYRQKRYLGIFVIGAIGFYLFLLGLWIFYFPDSILWKIISSIVVLVLIPVIFYFIRRFITWYYASQINRNNDQIQFLHREKKKLLKEVMEKETYNVARELLQKYDPSEIKKTAGLNLYSPLTNAPDILSRLPEMELRKRSSTSGSISPMVPARTPRLSDPGIRPLVPPTPIIKPGYNAPPGTKVVATPPRPVQHGQFMPPIRPAGIPMPCPILPRERSVLDKVVEYVVGDGPSNRYALICRQCKSHNGMALKEEFEYIAFRCCYCYLFNPARKQRLVAPRLTDPSQPTTRETSEDAASSSSPDESGSEGAGEDGHPDDQDREEAIGDIMTDHQQDEESTSEKSSVQESANTASPVSLPTEKETLSSTADQISSQEPSSLAGVENNIKFADDDDNGEEYQVIDTIAESTDLHSSQNAEIQPLSSPSQPINSSPDPS